MDTLILWCIRGSVLDFKNLKFQPTSCWVRLFDTLTAVLPLAFRLQMLHFTYKTCISFTNRALSRYEPIGVIIYANASFMEIPMEIIIKQYKATLGNQSFPSLGLV